MILSIITINYNDAKGLRKTFESIKNQTCHEFEYIVVDGGSSDGSKSVIEEYEQYISKWVSEPDKGIYNAMNKGAKMSTGDYMLFLNSGDNLYSDDVVEKVLALDMKSDIVCCSEYIYSETTHVIKHPPRNISLFTFIGGGSMLHPATFIHRNIFEKVGGYIEEYKIISDWCFFIDAMIVNNCSYELHEELIIAAFNAYGISSTNKTIDRMSAQRKFLENRFPRIFCDYLPLNDECIANVAFWGSDLRGTPKNIFLCISRCLNHFLGLRQKLSKRTIVEK